MTAEELKNKINAILTEKHSLQVYLLLKRNENFELRLADIEDDASPELEILFEGYIRSRISENADLQLCQLSTDDERKDAIYHYDYEIYPEELEILKRFNITNAIEDVQKFNFKQDDLSTLFGYVIYFGTMQNGLVLFKKHYPVLLIKRDSFLLGAKKDKERFEKVSGDDIIRMNGTVQILRLDGELYVIDIRMLERNMGFTELMKRSASLAVDAIEKLAIIEDIEVLRDSAEDISFARKLSKTQKASPIFNLNISKEAVIEFTKVTPELKGKFKYSEDGKTIQLGSRKSKDAFIKLLNDSFLRSELTKQYYEASAKAQLYSEA